MRNLLFVITSFPGSDWKCDQRGSASVALKAELSRIHFRNEDKPPMTNNKPQTTNNK